MIVILSIHYFYFFKNSYFHDYSTKNPVCCRSQTQHAGFSFYSSVFVSSASVSSSASASDSSSAGVSSSASVGASLASSASLETSTVSDAVLSQSWKTSFSSFSSFFSSSLKSSRSSKSSSKSSSHTDRLDTSAAIAPAAAAVSAPTATSPQYLLIFARSLTQTDQRPHYSYRC